MHKQRDPVGGKVMLSTLMSCHQEVVMPGDDGGAVHWHPLAAGVQLAGVPSPVPV